MLKFKFLVIYFCIVAVFITNSFCADLSRDVVVTYAFVPKDRLSDAVRSKVDALAIEAAWRNDSLAEKGPTLYPLSLRNAKYSIVIFVEVPASFALWGRIGIPIQNPKSPAILNVNLSPGYSGTYVIDGGGLILTKGIPVDPKPYEWIDFHTE